MVSVKKNTARSPPNLKYNVYITSQIEAYARQVIYEHLYAISKIPSCVINHVNFDQIFFSLNRNSPIPHKISHAIGHFKNIYVWPATLFQD